MERRELIKKLSLTGIGFTIMPTISEALMPSNNHCENKTEKLKIPKNPNIIFVICHDLGRVLGCYGKPIESPNIDKFAKNGVLFTNMFCNAPACSPSRGCLYSGMYSHNNGLIGLSHHGYEYHQTTKLMVDYFNDAGYDTIHIGLQHETLFSTPHKNRYKFELRKNWEDEHVSNAVDQAIELLKERKNNKTPFYLNIGTAETHDSQYNFKNEKWHKIYGETSKEKIWVPEYLPKNVASLEQHQGDLQAAIKHFDYHIGRLFEAIKQFDYEKNTLVVLTTDHGIANERAKSSLYQAGVEITYIMSMPDVLPHGLIVDNLLQNIDVAPTLLEFAGITTPETMQGKSFLNRIMGNAYKAHNYIFLERNYHGPYDPIRAIRTSRYLCIKNFDKNAKKQWLPNEVENEINKTKLDIYPNIYPERSLKRNEIELFDISIDPNCLNDISGNPEYSDVIEELTNMINKWLIETNDPILKGTMPPAKMPDDPFNDQYHH